MIYSLQTNKLISKAMEVAAKAHKDGTRKGSGIPYIVHPFEVAMILQANGMSDEVIAAGLLHDTLEDTELTKEDLMEIFGQEITNLVVGASEKLENRSNTPWEIRKKHTIEYLKNAPLAVMFIACADKLSNLRSMIRDYEDIGEELWSRFNRGYSCQKWYYNRLVESLNFISGIRMYKEFRSGVQELFDDKN